MVHLFSLTLKLLLKKNFKDFIYSFLERREGREKEREKNINVSEINRLIASHMPPTGT